MQAQRGAEVTQTRAGVSPRASPRIAAALLAASVIALDHITKLLVVRSLAVGESRQISGDFLRITHVRNTGAAFGLLKGSGGILVLAALVGVILFAAAVVRQPTMPAAAGAALVAAGAAGNLLDRLFREGGVVDFVDFSFWATFNVADAAITIGALLILIAGMGERARENTGDDEPDGPTRSGS